MNMNQCLVKVADVGNTVKKFASKNSPTILSGMAVVGVCTSVAMAVNATPKAMEIIEIEKNERYLKYKEEKGYEYAESVDYTLTPLEVVAACWRCYIPTALMTLVTISCIIGSNKINLKRQAALASLYSISEAKLKKYQDKVVKAIGENKAGKINDDLAQDILDSNPVDKHQIIFTGQGDTLCYDVLSGRYFKHDIEKLRRIENEFNKAILHDMCLSLNDLYPMMDLDTIRLGDDVGWNSDKLLAFDFRSKLASDGTPCLVIDYAVDPKYEYRWG